MFKKIKYLPFLLISACSHSSFPDIHKETVVTAEFPLLWMSQLQYANDDFMKRKPDVSCFTVEFIDENGMFYISFTPKSDFNIEGDIISVTQGGGNGECGRGVTYEFSKSGEFVKRFYQR